MDLSDKPAYVLRHVVWTLGNVAQKCLKILSHLKNLNIAISEATKNSL